MTTNPLMCLAVARLPTRGSVCEFGNQRLTISEEVAQRIQKSCGVRLTATTTAEFYQQLGFTSYVALDVNEEMNAVIADLNEPVELGAVFDVVTNNGTGEHLFDQAAVFRNAHNLCKVGGIMLHMLPMSPWLNHGFFNYNPILFRDLARANGYGWVFGWLGTRWGKTVELGEWAFVEKRPAQLIETVAKLAAKGDDVSLVCALRKTTDQPFKKPVQGKYLADITDPGLQQKYR